MRGCCRRKPCKKLFVLPQHPLPHAVPTLTCSAMQVEASVALAFAPPGPAHPSQHHSPTQPSPAGPTTPIPPRLAPACRLARRGPACRLAWPQPALLSVKISSSLNHLPHRPAFLALSISCPPSHFPSRSLSFTHPGPGRHMSSLSWTLLNSTANAGAGTGARAKGCSTLKHAVEGSLNSSQSGLLHYKI